LMLGGLYYAYMGWKLMKKTGRTDITALPSGLSTPAMFVYLFGIIYPLHYQGLDPETCWRAAVAACFIGGLIEVAGGFIGPKLRSVLPRAAMLGTVSGIALVWMATAGLFEVYHDPVLGLPVLVVALIGLIGGYVFKKKIPMLLVAIVFGIVYGFALGRVDVDTSHLGWTSPGLHLYAVFEGLEYAGKYLAIIIPIMIYAFIETMDNVESASAAGDDYPLTEAQVADGLCTVISSCFGGIMPNVVWLGHPGLKKGDSGIGYSWVGGVLFGVCALFGAFALFNSIMPQVIAVITYLWCAMLMLVQGFTDTPRRHGAALAIALIPHIADLAFTYVSGALGAVSILNETVSIHLEPLNQAGHMFLDSSDEISMALISYGVMWKGVAALKCGAILTSILWASVMVFIIDRQLLRATVAFVVAAVLAFFGFVHAPALAVNAAPAFAVAYLEGALICWLFHIWQERLIDVPRRFDYV
ncbi:xanthine/uracil/vitamin C permease, partial [Deltaproteobacteria bacterium OttesenSCG-928-K17]|nr:xanthine/uracil/vitamin C permease [Deltaproteobacteria bacterium OttesenSCG-928-K17]